MLVVRSPEGIPEPATGAVLALGNFDGVHRGHQALLTAAVTEGRREGRPAGALVFDPHPREFFQPGEPHFHLTTLAEKLDVFRGLGLDVAIVLPFDAGLAKLDAEAFIARVLVGMLAVSHVVVGYHFFFGRGRSGTPETLREAGARHGFGVTVVAPVAEAGEAFSSTAIRLSLAQGDVAGAARALGRWWQVSGRVVEGARRGAGLGFPTANVAMPKGTALAHGIYAVRASLDGRALDGVAYLGTRPMFDDGSPVLEVHLFDFGEDIYGRELTMAFIAHIRGDRKFDGIEALKTQMAADCAEARRRLAAAPAEP